MFFFTELYFFIIKQLYLLYSLKLRFIINQTKIQKNKYKYATEKTSLHTTKKAKQKVKQKLTLTNN